MGSWRKEANMTGERTYMCIDLKSFYASVECVERGLDPLTTNLVVRMQSGQRKRFVWQFLLL